MQKFQQSHLYLPVSGTHVIKQFLISEICLLTGGGSEETETQERKNKKQS